MRFDKKLLNNLSKKYAMLALGAASILGACSKEHTDPIEQHDIDVYFDVNSDAGTSRLHPDTLRRLAKQPDVADIYLVSRYALDDAGPKGMKVLLDSYLRPAIESVPGRVFGKDKFIVQPGVLNPTDSIWLRQNNWEVIVQQKQR